MRTTKEELIQRISEIEDQLRALKIEVQELEDQSQESSVPRSKKFYEVGDRVRINNPKYGQDSEGVVFKANFETGWITIQTTKGKVRRQYFNISLVHSG